jgi:methylated-DNA-[protein]-cysteine S-methyltransferase
MPATPVFRHAIRTSSFGPIAIVWREAGKGPKVQRIFLPTEGEPEEPASVFPGSRRGRHPRITELTDAILRFLDGSDVTFSLETIALDICSPFQRRVLRAEHRIPRGWVSTYGGIAAHLGIPFGGRAVGRALATNPFPIVIPCHRAVRSEGMLGGYQGGTAMKRVLLEFEGAAISEDGRICTPKLFYRSAQVSGS